MRLIYTLALAVMMMGNVWIGGLAQAQIWPLSNSTTPDTVDKPYGFRTLCGTCSADFHRGLDFKASRGTPVHAVADGTVVRYGQNDPALPRWGNFVVIALEPMTINGELVNEHQVAYLHLDSIDGSIVGSTLPMAISQGDPVGTVGNSGQGINTVHLHFDYYQGANDGWIHREEARHPLQLLPYSSQEPTLVEVTKQSSSTLRLRVRQAPTSLDIVGFKVEHDGDSATHGSAPIVIDFDAKVGINMSAPEYEDLNPFESTTFLPKYFNKNSSYYELKLDFDGNWANVSDITVTLTDVSGNEWVYPFNL